MTPRRRIVRLAVDEISTVDRPAVNRAFRLFKRGACGESAAGEGVNMTGWSEFAQALKAAMGLSAPSVEAPRADLALGAEVPPGDYGAKGNGGGTGGSPAGSPHTAADGFLPRDAAGGAGSAANSGQEQLPPAAMPGFALPGPGSAQTYPGPGAANIGPPGERAGSSQEFQKAFSDVLAGQQALAQGMLDIARQLSQLQKSIGEIDAIFGELAGPIESAQGVEPAAAGAKRSIFADVV